MKVIAILSTRYAGSTLLDYMLGSHKSALSLTELRAFITGERKPFSCKKCNPADSCPIYSPSTTKKLLEIGPHSNLYRTIAEVSGANILIDSSKNIPWFRSTLKGLVKADVLILHISKSPEEYGGSERSKYHKTSLRSVEEIGRKWWQVNSQILQFLSRSPYPSLTIRYRDLISNPTDTLTEILTVLGEKYEDGMEYFWKYDHHPLWGNKGTRSHISGTDSIPNRWMDESELNKEIYRENHQRLFMDEKWKKLLTEKEVNGLYSIKRVSQLSTILDYGNPFVEITKETRSTKPRNVTQMVGLRYVLLVSSFHNFILKMTYILKRVSSLQVLKEVYKKYRDKI